MVNPASETQHDALDPRTFRRVLGHYPSGVVAVTSADVDHKPVGMIASSFTSVSLDPPMVAFFPAKSSSTWPLVRNRGAFCINVLAADQEVACRQLAAKGPDKFAGLDWSGNARGLPALTGSVAWIDCDVVAIHDAGDHEIVVGQVRSLEVDESALPLLFFKGGYGRFASSSMAAITEVDLLEHLRMAQSMRPHLLDASNSLGVEIFATGIADDELVIVSTSGHPDPSRLPTQVGLRMPFFPPLGATVAAFDDWDAWLNRGVALDAQTRDLYRGLLSRIHDRGWSATVTTSASGELERVMVLTPDSERTREQTEVIRQIVDKLGTDHELPNLEDGSQYAVRSVTVPVPEPGGRARLALTAYGLPPTSDRSDVQRYVSVLQQVAHRVQPPRSVLGR
ncbi:hypothetical protein CH298_26680 [Rhodococcoides fascians]|uniref:flavin reductase family protein n=1 Tax=Rhodococcoides fascians TaxID=1828 RepID=UPI000B9B8CD6|nr:MULTISPECIES: flavin reductase family protein [Rhodococcus]OZD68961.1 hypothetical protein CH263_08735 [Rhodococcus sp. 06-1059B-a]OZE81357.1 hypothetical protein CH303_27220 [Rhodococcus fascians]OZF10181.1 hypothetical protein CH298_26680 [Rhodococcus fascians]OZF13272.1 hypothetical protein CH297_26975 [Rhodococcus fascians]OZF59369.1 hypothetical protein CH308_27420 [Rhodococcus fascians]